MANIQNKKQYLTPDFTVFNINLSKDFNSFKTLFIFTSTSLKMFLY